MTTKEILSRAVKAKSAIFSLSTELKNRVLLSMADALIAHTDAILSANATDVEAASGTLSTVMIDRLLLTRERVLGMANGIRKSFRSVVNGAGYFLIFLSEAFLPLLIFAAIAVVIVLIVKKASKKVHQKRMAKYEAQQLAYQQAQQQTQNNSQQ